MISRGSHRPILYLGRDLYCNTPVQFFKDEIFKDESSPLTNRKVLNYPPTTYASYFEY